MPEIEDFATARKPEGMLTAVHFTPMMHLNKRTPDGRLIKADGFSTREFPLPFHAMFENTMMGHMGSVPVGRLDKINVQANATPVEGWGWYADTPEGQKAAFLMQTKMVRGNSVDLSSNKYDISISKDGQLQIDFITSVLKGTTQVSYPAFPDAKGKMSDDLAAAMAIAVPLLPDVIEAHFGDSWEIGLDAEFAAGPPIPTYNAAHFRDPKLTGPTPLSVSRDGHLKGHLALWGECHIGVEGRCITPPRSRSNYANFAKHLAHLDDGTDCYVGSLVLGGGHSPGHYSWEEANEYYGNACRAWANVAIGEDQFGIWISGAPRDSATPADIEDGCMAAVSGHWKKRNGAMELFAILSVNAEGYPVPRPKAYAEMSEILDLCAAGVVQPVRQVADLGDAVQAFSRVADLLEADMAERQAKKIRDRVLASG